jgi:hypothetical protein
MKFYPEELELAKRYVDSISFERLTNEQISTILNRGRELLRWFREHQRVHFAISACLIVGLLILDGLILAWAPALFVTERDDSKISMILLASFLLGSAHSYLLYSMVLYSIHEGAAHNLIFPGRGPISSRFAFLANNLCRLGAADPIYYAQTHLSHHTKFGTEQDEEFLSFVRPQRYWRTFIPFAMFFNFSDFLVHRPLTDSKSSTWSLCVSFVYHVGYAIVMIDRFGYIFTLTNLVLVTPHVGFYVDRLRQFTEHNMLMLDNQNGARSFGLGFWGIFVGGGPWGQPCHLIHHLMPSIPWYQQLILHRNLTSILTARQHRQFALKPFVSYPRLLWRLWTEPTKFGRRSFAPVSRPGPEAGGIRDDGCERLESTTRADSGPLSRRKRS